MRLRRIKVPSVDVPDCERRRVIAPVLMLGVRIRHRHHRSRGVPRHRAHAERALLVATSIVGTVGAVNEGVHFANLVMDTFGTGSFHV